MIARAAAQDHGPRIGTADGTVGRPKAIDAVVRDGRRPLEAGAIDVWKHGFTLAQWPTGLMQRDFYTPANVEQRYYREQEQLIKQEYAAHHPTSSSTTCTCTSTTSIATSSDHHIFHRLHHLLTSTASFRRRRLQVRREHRGGPQ